MDKYRCFLAIPIPTIDLTKYTDKFKQYKVKYSLVKSDMLHITLHFFGDITQDNIEKVKEELKNFSFLTFTLGLGGVGKIPPKGKNTRVLYIDVYKGRDELIALANSIRHILSELGFRTEKRPFLPHLTIARIRGGYDIKGLTDCWESNQRVKFLETPIDSIEFLQSTLTEKGPIYKTLATFKSNQ